MAHNADYVPLLEVITAAVGYIHGGSSESQDRYTAWRETYKRVFGDYPPYVRPHWPLAELNDGKECVNG